MVEQGSTKKAILDKALDLFSVQGYEATSIAQSSMKNAPYLRGRIGTILPLQRISRTLRRTQRCRWFLDMCAIFCMTRK